MKMSRVVLWSTCLLTLALMAILYGRIDYTAPRDVIMTRVLGTFGMSVFAAAGLAVLGTIANRFMAQHAIAAPMLKLFMATLCLTVAGFVCVGLWFDLFSAP